MLNEPVYWYESPNPKVSQPSDLYTVYVMPGPAEWMLMTAAGPLTWYGIIGTNKKNPTAATTITPMAAFRCFISTRVEKASVVIYTFVRKNGVDVLMTVATVLRALLLTAGK